MLKRKDIQEIQSLLSKKSRIVITTHYNPDGDAMGSCLGLYHYLISLKHTVNIITPNSWPSFLDWMPGSDTCIAGNKQLKKAEKIIAQADIIFSLDYNTLKRTEELAPYIESAKAVKILIDHHIQPDSFARYTFSDTKASSTCQMVFDFIKALSPDITLNKDCATCLYTGIMTDTGSFKFRSTTAHTHYIVSELLKCGINNTEIHENVLDNNTYERMRLLGFSLCEKLTVLNEYHTAFIALSSDELNSFGFKKGDTEGFVNYALSILDIKFSALFLELENGIKISFRSKGRFDVNTFARKYFNGGGHLNAAGGSSDLTLDETILKFVGLLPKHKKDLSKK